MSTYRQNRPGRGERPHRSHRIYPKLIGDVETERRAITAITVASDRLWALEEERRQLIDVRAEAVLQLTECGFSPREIAKAVENRVSHETVRSDLRRIGRMTG